VIPEAGLNCGRPSKEESVSFTTVPEVNDALQVGAQLIPAGLLFTVPLAVPANCADNW
jgi:hypothetical protein